MACEAYNNVHNDYPCTETYVPDEAKHVVFIVENFRLISIAREFSSAGKRENSWLETRHETTALIKVMLNIFEITVDFILSFRLDQRKVEARFSKIV